MPDDKTPTRKLANLPTHRPDWPTFHRDRATGEMVQTIVYDKNTGRPIALTSIDAREAVSLGHCTYEPPDDPEAAA